MLQIKIFLPDEAHILFTHIELKILSGKERKVRFDYILKAHGQNQARNGKYMKNPVLQQPAGTASVQDIVRCILLLYGKQDLFRHWE